MNILVLGNDEGGAGGRSSISSKSGGTAKYLSSDSSNIEIYHICSKWGVLHTIRSAQVAQHYLHSRHFLFVSPSFSCCLIIFEIFTCFSKIKW